MRMLRPLFGCAHQRGENVHGESPPFSELGENEARRLTGPVGFITRTSPFGVWQKLFDVQLRAWSF